MGHIDLEQTEHQNLQEMIKEVVGLPQAGKDGKLESALEAIDLTCKVVQASAAHRIANALEKLSRGK